MISKFSLLYQRFCRYRVRYALPGAAGRIGHVPAPPTGPASWSSTRLDGLYSSSCMTVLTPFPAGVQVPSVAAVARPWYVLPRPAGHGGQSWFQVIAVLVIWWWSTWCQSSMLSACHWYSASTLLVTQVCSLSESLNQQGQRPLTDTAGPQLPEACGRLMT